MINYLRNFRTFAAGFFSFMTTLSNVRTRRGEAVPPCAGFFLLLSPEVFHQKGVSVKYVLTKTKAASKREQ